MDYYVVMKNWRIIFRIHAIQRMFTRQISDENVRYALDKGEVIENYPNDTPYPSRLLLGWIGSRPLHVVVAENSEQMEQIIITAYEPNPDQWEEGFKKRKV